MKRYFQEPFTLLFALFALFLPLLLRVVRSNPLIGDPASYTYLSASTPYGLLLNLLPFGQAVVLLSVLLGLLSAFLFHRLTGLLLRSTLARVLWVLLFLCNPLFFTLFTTLSPFTVGIPAALLLLIAWKKERLFLGMFSSLLLALFTPALAFLLILLLLLIGTYRKMLFPGFVLAIILLFTGELFHPFSRQIVEFGVINGLSIILVLFAVIEVFIHTLRQQYRRLLFLPLLLLAPWNTAALILAGLLSAPLAADLIARLAKRKWAIAQAKQLALLLIGCLLLFVFLTHMLTLADTEPTSALLDLLEEVPEGVLLAPPALSPVILDFTPGEPFLSTKNCEERCPIAEALYHERRLAPATAVLDRYDIRFLLITTEMRQGSTWIHDEDGLLFLLKHSERFKKVASSPEGELWRYEASQ